MCVEHDIQSPFRKELITCLPIPKNHNFESSIPNSTSMKYEQSFIIKSDTISMHSLTLTLVISYFFQHGYL